MGNASPSQQQGPFGLKLKKELIDQPPPRFRVIAMCHQDQVQETQQEWLVYLKQECEDLSARYNWPSQILHSLKKYMGYPVSYYQKEVFACRGLVGKTPVANAKKPGKNNQKRKKREREPLSIQDRYRKLFNQSELIDDQPISEQGSVVQIPSNSTLNKKLSILSSYNIHTGNLKESFSSVSSSPSYVFPEFFFQRQEKSNMTKDLVDALELYVLKTDVIAKHFRDQNHVLGHVMSVFAEVFIAAYSGVTERLTHIRKEGYKNQNMHGMLGNSSHPHVINDDGQRDERESEKLNPEELEISNRAIGEVQQFIRVMQETMSLFYNLQRDDQSIVEGVSVLPDHFTKDNMINFVTSQIFKNTKIYKILFDLTRLEDILTEQRLSGVMVKLFEWKPQDFFVSDKFCLNEKTLRYYNKDDSLIPEEHESEQHIIDSLCLSPQKGNKRVSNDSNQTLGKAEADKTQLSQYAPSEDQRETKDADDERYERDVEQDEEAEKAKLEIPSQQQDSANQMHSISPKEKELQQQPQQQQQPQKAQNTASLRDRIPAQEDKQIDSDTELGCDDSKNESTNVAAKSPTKRQKRDLVEQALIDIIGIQIDNRENNTNNYGCSKMTRTDVDHYYSNSFENTSDLLDDNIRDNFINKRKRGYSVGETFFSKITENDEDFDERASSAGNEEKIKNNTSSSGSSSSGTASGKADKDHDNNSSSEQEKNLEEISPLDGFSPDNLYWERLKKENYFNCMKYIMSIRTEQSPAGKMKMVVKASEHIHSCVNTFYKAHGIAANNCLDADDVLSLFSYFSSKCFLYDMNTHVKLICKFITPNLLNSASGYYLTTIHASLQNILELPVNKDNSILQSFNIIPR